MGLTDAWIRVRAGRVAASTRWLSGLAVAQQRNPPSTSVLLTQQDIARGWRIFRGRLYDRSFPAQFIEGEGRDLFAEGQLDVIRLIDRGLEVYWPCGLLVHCAWRRTQRLVEKRTRNPQSVSLEALAELASEQMLPEEEVISNDLDRFIRAAVAFLDPPDREIIQLTYFGEMTCTEAGRLLGWSSSKSQRIHQRSLGRLRTLLDRQVYPRNSAAD